MAAENIEIRGLEGLEEKLAKAVNPETIKAALEKACMLVERSARQKAPKGNGQLRNSITSKVEGLEGVVYTPLEYAPYVEYGTGLFAEEGGRQDVPWSYMDDKGEWHTTVGQHPRPFMRPALNENRDKIKEILREGLLND